MAKLLLTTLFFLIALGAHALSVDEKDILKFRGVQHFKSFHQSLISLILEREKQSVYPQKLQRQHDDMISFYDQKLFIDFLIKESFAHNTNRLCFFGGWPSVVVGGKCKTPWSMQNRSEVTRFSPQYDSDHYCGATNLFRCNPVLFGGGANGKGVCIEINGYGSTTQTCFEKLGDNLDDLYEKYTTDENFRENYQELSAEILSFCDRRPDYSACEFLKKSVAEFYGHVCAKQEIAKEEAIVESSSFWLNIDWGKWFRRNPSQSEPELTQEEPSTDGVDIEAPTSASSNTSTEPSLVLSTSDGPSPASETSTVQQQDDPVSPQAVERSLRPPARPDNLAPLPRPRATRSVGTLLRGVSGEDAIAAGYYRNFGRDRTSYGTNYTIWHIRETGRRLAAQNMIMGINNISKRGGGRLPPHTTHRNGRDVDIQFMNASGIGNTCNFGGRTYYPSGCFDVEKNVALIRTIISVDRSNIGYIVINDSRVRRRIRQEFGGLDIRSDRGRSGVHDNHYHVNFHR